MTATPEVPMPQTYYPDKYGCMEECDTQALTLFVKRADAIAYADARCEKLQAELDQCHQLERSAMDGLAFAYKFNVAMGNGMRAAGCTIEGFDIKNVRAEKAEAERDALLNAAVLFLKSDDDVNQELMKPQQSRRTEVFKARFRARADLAREVGFCKADAAIDAAGGDGDG
jgi:hypothetical protein